MLELIWLIVQIKFMNMEASNQLQSIARSTRSESRINVLQVIGNASKGGMENYITNFIEHLPADQIKLTCICPYESRFTNTLRKLGVEDIFITPIADDPDWRSIQLAVEVARLHQIDVLHAHMPKAHVLAGLAGCLIHKPVVATVHGMHVTSHELGIARAVGSHLITNCQEAYTQALAMGIPGERVNLVRNGVDIDAFTPDHSGKKLRNSIKVPAGTPLVGFVGRLEPEKGPDLFVRAAEYIHKRQPDVHFVIVGDGAMRKKLKKMCGNMDLDRKVHFVDWTTNTVDIYPGLDVLAHTSRSDGTSLVLLEAMACGCPIVGLSVGGVREIIEHESTGLLLGAGEWEELAIQILKLLKNPDRLRVMGKAARVRVENQFNVCTNNRRTTEILRKVAFSEVNVQRFSNINVLAL